MAGSIFNPWSGEGADLATRWAMAGLVYYASDAAQADTITTQTSLANTTPSIMIDVPSGTTVVPLMVTLGQTGTVAGGAVGVIIEIDNADRYNTGGTAETILGARTTGAETVPSGVAVYTGATANAGYGVRIYGQTIGMDVAPAEGAVQEILWTPQAGYDFLVGPAAFLVYTYAASTAPTLFWSVKFAAFPTAAALY